MTSTSSRQIVLVVDDEKAIRLLERRVLEHEGYDVIEASRGLEAIHLIAQGDTIDLLMTDLEMPELSGDEMVRRVRAIRPDLKVLYVTSHINTLMDARPLWAGEAFLDKPFNTAGLAEAVSLLLHGTLSRPKE